MLGLLDMKRRILPFALIISSAIVAYACSSKDSDNNPGGNTNPEGGPNAEGGPNDEGGPQGDGGDEDGAVNPSGNPVEGVTPRQVADLAQFSDGPQWLGGALYVALPTATNTGGGGPGLMVRIVPDATSIGQVTEIAARAGVPADGTGPIGNSIDKGGNLITAERTKVTRMVPDGGATTVIAATFAGDGGALAFDTPNDIVARLSDNTIFLTDPGFFSGGVIANHLIKIAPDGTAISLEDFPDVERPNGIALTKDEKTLYVANTQPSPGKTKPIIRKYTVAANGTVSAPTQFAELPANSEPDGMAIDDSGNLYVAFKQGVNVYKADGTRWGAEPSVAITIPAGQMFGTTGVTFGGADRKTVYATTGSGRVYELKVKIPGLVQ